MEEIISEDKLKDDYTEASLMGQHTMLISSLKPEEYALALSKLQSLGLPIISNKAPLCSMTGVMGLNIPMDEVNHTTKVLKGAWQGPG